MTLPVLSAADLRPEAVLAALRGAGGFLLEDAVDATLRRQVLAAAHDFFTLPREAKLAVAIDRSPHFRGWSEMHNERDWREQLHLGRDRPARSGAAYTRLEGPNLWPPDPTWRAVVTRYMDGVQQVGEGLLAAIAAALGLPGGAGLRAGSDAYALMKLIGYHPQAGSDAPRPGVAAHVDFSWLTITLQDSAGLEIKTPDGSWQTVPPGDALWVHPGEVLWSATRGLICPTPHRVLNRSLDRTRVSLPLFVNPALDAVVPVLDIGAAAEPPPAAGEHVHRVLPLDTAPTPFCFGEAEWQRKGLDRWCFECTGAARQ